MTAVKDGLCFSHLQIQRGALDEVFEQANNPQVHEEAGPKRKANKPKIQERYYAEIFTWSREEIDRRMKQLTPKQIETLEYFCDGYLYRTMAAAQGVNEGTIRNRVNLAMEWAGVQTRLELICLYTLWRIK